MTNHPHLLEREEAAAFVIGGQPAVDLLRLDRSAYASLEGHERDALDKLAAAKTSNLELLVLAGLSSAWATFQELPDQDSNDRLEFRLAVHACQRIVSTRLARRVDPGVWAPASGRVA